MLCNMKTFKYYPYTVKDLEKIVFSKGFISPKGEFYNCWEYTDKKPDKYKENSHRVFAEKYCEEILHINLRKKMQELDEFFSILNGIGLRSFSEYFDETDAFIHLEGFIYFSCLDSYLLEAPKILTPYPVFNNKSTTDRQKELLIKIWNENDYPDEVLEEHFERRTAEKILMRNLTRNC